MHNAASNIPRAVPGQTHTLPPTRALPSPSCSNIKTLLLKYLIRGNKIIIAHKVGGKIKSPTYSTMSKQDLKPNRQLGNKTTGSESRVICRGGITDEMRLNPECC